MSSRRAARSVRRGTAASGLAWLVVAAAWMLPGRVFGAEELSTILEERWEGSWVVVDARVFSGCWEFYTDNRIRGGEVAFGGGRWKKRLARFRSLLPSSAASEAVGPPDRGEGRSFEPGELGTVSGVKVKGGRVDLLVDLQPRVLVPYTHGPFTLYRVADCRVQLQFEVDEEAIERQDLAEIERVLTSTLTRFESEDAARAAPEWNRRPDDSYPDGYERTYERYVAWRNDEIDSGLAVAWRALADLGGRLQLSTWYLESYSDGVRAVEGVVHGADCERLVGSDFETFRRRPRGDEVTGAKGVLLDLASSAAGQPGTYKALNARGYEDGQRLAYELAMLQQLPGCRLQSGEEERGDH